MEIIENGYIYSYCIGHASSDSICHLISSVITTIFSNLLTPHLG